MTYDFKMYDVEFSEEYVEIKLKKTKFISYALGIIFDLFLIIPLLTFSILFFIKKDGYFYAISFLLCAIVLLSFLLHSTVIDKKREKIFRFIIDSKGITNVEINNTYFIPWSELVYYGVVNNNSIASIKGSGAPYQSCIYFSKTFFSEKKLRRRFDRFIHNIYMHCSNSEIIVIGLDTEDKEKDDEMFKKICYYVNRYCDSAEQINFIKEKTE